MTGNSLGALRGWDTRRANARKRVLEAIESARGVQPASGVPPGAGRVQITRDGAVVFATPRGAGGRLERQAALGVGSVTDDIIGRHGAFISRGGVHAGLANVTGLRTVTVRFILEQEGEEAYRVYKVTVDFGRARNAREKELGIARVIQDAARAIMRNPEYGSSWQVYVTLVRVGAPITLHPSKRVPKMDAPRKPGSKRKPKVKPRAKE